MTASIVSLLSSITLKYKITEDLKKKKKLYLKKKYTYFKN